MRILTKLMTVDMKERETESIVFGDEWGVESEGDQS